MVRATASTRPIGFFPPGYFENLGSRSKGPLAAMILEALDVHGPRLRMSVPQMRRRLDAMYSALYPERIVRFERLLRPAGLTPIARATDVTIHEIFHGDPSFGFYELTTSPGEMIAQELTMALDVGLKSLAREKAT